MTANTVIVLNESKGKQTHVTSNITKSELAWWPFETIILSTHFGLCVLFHSVSPKFTNRASDYDALSYLLCVDTH